jgi:prepilin-type N-terminal cleavage/methylation domain-containing protein
MRPINNRQSKTEKAFTLIELLVVIAIVGILAGLAVVNMSGATEAARIAKLKVYSNSLNNSLLSNRVSEWRLDEGTGTTTFDAIGSSNGDLTGHAPTWQSGANCVSGSCLSFDGSDDYVTIPSASGNSAIQTFGLWVYIRGAVSGNQYCIDQGGNNNSLSIYNNHFRIITNTSFIYDSVAVPVTNRWYFLTKVFDGSRLSLYVDGKLDGGMPASGLAPNAITFGNYGGGGNYKLNGTIDEVRIYNAALASSVIRDQYLAGLDRLLAGGQITKQDHQQRIIKINPDYCYVINK